MKIISPNRRKRQMMAALNADLMVAIGILAVAVLPLSVSWMAEAKVLRGHYYRAVAMQIVDGEMEILAAGEWKSLAPGSREYQVKARSAKSLPAGKFQFTQTNKIVRLEWIPNKRGNGGRVVREVVVK